MDKYEKLKEEYDKAKAWGLLTSYDLHDCNPETIRSSPKIKEFTRELCKKIGLKPYELCHVVHFGERPEVEGFSMTQLIETSLVSAHFVNETNRVFLDVFSCSYYNPKIVADYAKEFFGAKDVVFNYLLRK